MGYQGEGVGEVEGQAAWLVGRKADMSREVEGQAAWLVGRKVDKGRWVEQGLVSGLDKKIVREFGQLER